MCSESHFQAKVQGHKKHKDKHLQSRGRALWFQLPACGKGHLLRSSSEPREEGMLAPRQAGSNGISWWSQVPYLPWAQMLKSPLLVARSAATGLGGLPQIITLLRKTESKVPCLQRYWRLFMCGHQVLVRCSQLHASLSPTSGNTNQESRCPET